MTELDKLERYLKDHKIPYERTDKRQLFTNIIDPCVETYSAEWHKISVPNNEVSLWDVICQKGSYGYEEGLLELMGSLVTDEEYEIDSVVGYLTADDVIRRIENSPEKQAL